MKLVEFLIRMKIKTDLKGLLVKQSDAFMTASKLFLVNLYIYIPQIHFFWEFD